MNATRIILSACVILVGIYLIVGGNTFSAPETLPTTSIQADRNVQYEFKALYDNQRLTSSLAEPGKYTVVEGYLDSCGVCKRLEAKFPAFLDARPDVVIRRVRYEEKNSISFTSPEQVQTFVDRMNMYKNNRFSFDGEKLDAKTCGTPHIEIYGPDGNLVASDECGDTNDKSGSAFLNNWIAAETG